MAKQASRSPYSPNQIGIFVPSPETHSFTINKLRRNQLLLRDDILNQISSEFSRVSKGYKAEFSVEISGPSVAHLNELEVRLAREEVSFNEIIDHSYKR